MGYWLCSTASPEAAVAPNSVTLPEWSEAGVSSRLAVTNLTNASASIASAGESQVQSTFLEGHRCASGRWVQSHILLGDHGTALRGGQPSPQIVGCPIMLEIPW